MNPILEAAIGLALFLASLCGAGFIGYSYAKDEAKVAMEEYTAKVLAQTQALKDADAKALSQVQLDKEAAVNDYETKLTASNTAYWAAVRKLRDATADRDRLKAAAAAPVECRSFAAPPTQLSVTDATVALGIAREGDRAITQLALCQSEYNSLITKLNAEQ
jgi:hypothetical protein